MENEVFQIAFPGMTIDEDATFERVEKELKTAALYKRMGFVRREAALTPSYTVKENTGFTGISKQTENIAIHNVDGEEKAKLTYERVALAISRLTDVHREIVTTRYLSHPEPLDINVWMELNLSERTYYRLKREAMSELAYALRLEVIKDDIESLAGTWQ
ncbi:ArpU family phage packaging/lysis transcriptional regulator [Paenibacillus humicus]|uniref:ArpU family phage packaging/lysis transcriptional regulator n=1 Tax=Paenibacillus humicus TaxID=412861 RepID=UPI003D2E88BD